MVVADVGTQLERAPKGKRNVLDVGSGERKACCWPAHDPCIIKLRAAQGLASRGCPWQPDTRTARSRSRTTPKGWWTWRSSAASSWASQTPGEQLNLLVLRLRLSFSLAPLRQVPGSIWRRSERLCRSVLCSRDLHCAIFVMQWRKALAEWARVLQPGGYVAFRCFHYLSLLPLKRSSVPVSPAMQFTKAWSQSRLPVEVQHRCAS